jgi:pyruvyltransferase
MTWSKKSLSTVLSSALERLLHPTLSREKRFMFGDRSRPYCDNVVNLMFWKTEIASNVGDLLSEVIVHLILHKAGINPEKEVVGQRQLAAIGSILDRVVLPSTIWGSGLRTRESKPHPVTLDLRAVRGPLTAAALEAHGQVKCTVFGDPGLLMPLFYSPRARSGKDEILVIPHFRHIEKYSGEYKCISTLTNDWMGFIDDIYNARFVLSSSLHGLILAEAYGIPTALLPDLDADDFKYCDYYRGTGRIFELKPVTVAQALDAEPVPAMRNLDSIQKQLMDAFPFDLWD